MLFTLRDHLALYFIDCNFEWRLVDGLISWRTIILEAAIPGVVDASSAGVIVGNKKLTCNNFVSRLL